MQQDMQQENVQQAKKKFPVWGWFLAGCGCLALVVGAVVVGGGVFVANKAADIAKDFEGNPAQAAAELAVRVNPELDLVESDREAGTITIRNNQTDEVITVDFEAITEGRIEWEGSGGSGGMTFDENGLQVEATDESGETQRMTVDAGEDGITMTGPDGTARIGGGGEAPPWVPVQAGVELQGTFATESGGEIGGMVTYETDDPIDTVVEFYRSELEDDGYQIESSSLRTGSAHQESLQARNAGAGRTVNVAVSDTEGKRSVVIQFEGPQ